MSRDKEKRKRAVICAQQNLFLEIGFPQKHPAVSLVLVKDADFHKVKISIRRDIMVAHFQRIDAIEKNAMGTFRH